MPKKGYGPETGLTYLKRYRIGGQEGGGYLHKERAKEYLEEQKRKRAERQGQLAAAATPPIPSGVTTVPILGGSLPAGGKPVPSGPLPGGAEASPHSAPVPGWWINQAIQNPSDPNQQFANVANALLPTLAPEDQRTLANYLATNYKDVYGGYSNVNFGMAPTEITDQTRKQYLNPQRAQMALSLLEKMKTASGGQNMGTGYDFLKNAVGLINQFAPGGTMTREGYNQFTNAVSGLVSGAGSDLSAYANLAQLFNLPKFSAGPLVSNAPNQKLFG
jgi:hypothetical protein